MWISSIRGLLVLALAASAAAWQPLPWGLPVNVGLGVLAALAAIVFETRVRSATPLQAAAAFIGAVVGIVTALLISIPLAKILVGSLIELLFQEVGRYPRVLIASLVIGRRNNLMEPERWLIVCDDWRETS